MSQSQSDSTNSNQGSNDAKKLPDIYLPPNKTGKKTLVLDLDETLVHSQFGPFDIQSDVVINIEIENEIHDIHVLVRPGVKEFLEKISKKYEIVIFTASISKYAGPLLDILDKNKLCSYRLFREHCTLINTSFVKDLKKLGRDLKDVVIVDNSPMAYLLNSDNGLPILTWFDDKNDRELYRICPILEFLSLVPDVRDYICKIVVNNEISYNSAMNVINDYNEMLTRKQKNENEKDTNIIENNNEISDSSENNLVFIKGNNNEKRQQININIINNNITNYIYDNKNQDKKENINDNIQNKNNNNNSNNNDSKKEDKNNFNPNNVIASVSKPNKPNSSNEINSLTSLISNQKNMNKNKNNSMKNINNKDKLTKTNLNMKMGQYNTNDYLHKKSESTGMGYKNKTKKKVELFNTNNTNNNYINSIRNNTNYNSKSYNRKEIKVNNTNSIVQKDNKMTKSTKSLKNNAEKPFICNNNNKKNISVNKKIYNKNSSKNKYEKSQIILYNEGNMTTVHKKQKSLINFNSLKDKTYRNNNKKNKNNMPNNLLHSVDFAKNEVNTYYHNDNFPFFKQQNFFSGNNNINDGKVSSKNHRNKFLKSGKINKKGVGSSSIDNVPNKLNIDNNSNNNFISNNLQPQNNININNNNFKYIKKKSKDKKFLFNHTLVKEKENNILSVSKENNDNTDNNNLLKENINNSALNINNHPNFDLTNSSQINQRSESMKNLTNNNNEISNNQNMNKNKKKGATNHRPKSSNIFKRTKQVNLKKKEMKRNASGKNGKNIKSLKYDINEILERRGIAKSNRAKDSKGGIKYNISSCYVFNSSNINNSNRNKSKKIL